MKPSIHLSIGLAIMLLASAPAPAASKSLSPLSPLDGLLLNRTLSRAGHEFSRLFNLYWQDYAPPSSHSLVIKEQPSPRQGNEIRIEYRHRVLFRHTLSSGRVDLRALTETVRQAAPQVAQQIEQIELQHSLFGEQDLAQDEF